MSKSKADHYRQQLERIHGKPVGCGDYIGYSRKIEHVCTSCGKPFLATPKRMLNKASATTCVQCTMEAHIHHVSPQKTGFFTKLLKKFDTVQCTNFTSMHRASEFKCLCGSTWAEKPKDMLSADFPCDECATLTAVKDGDMTVREINMLLEVRKARFRIDNDRTVKCLKEGCGATWSEDDLGMLFRFGYSCIQCELRSRVTKEQHSAFVSSYDNALTMHTQAFAYTHKGADYAYRPLFVTGTCTAVEIRTRETLTKNWERDRSLCRALNKKGVILHLMYFVQGRLEELPSEWFKWKEQEAMKFVRSFDVKHIRILCMDPGVTNFAWSVLEAKRGHKFKLRATGMLRNTIPLLTTESRENTDKFATEIRQIIEEYNVDHMIMERFMSRGMKGLTIELVNVMIGIMMGLWPGESSSFKLLTAAQWKNEWNRRSDLRAFYERAPCEVHQVDSIGIGMYGASFWFDEEPFKGIAKFEKHLLKQIQESNLERHK